MAYLSVKSSANPTPKGLPRQTADQPTQKGTENKFFDRFFQLELFAKSPADGGRPSI
jgi:hypothetical protein